MTQKKSPYAPPKAQLGLSNENRMDFDELSFEIIETLYKDSRSLAAAASIYLIIAIFSTIGFILRWKSIENPFDFWAILWATTATSGVFTFLASTFKNPSAHAFICRACIPGIIIMPLGSFAGLMILRISRRNPELMNGKKYPFKRLEKEYYYRRRNGVC